MRALWLASALTLAGCADPRLPPVALPALAPAYQTADAGVERAAWLRQLADPGLDRLIALGLARSPDLEAALARIATARGLSGQARAARRPNLDASASVTRRRTSLDQIGTNLPQEFAGNINREQTLFEPGVTASLDLDLFGRLSAEARAARLRLDAADADARAVRLTLVTDIARNWAQARAAAARAAVARENVRDSEELLRVTDVRVRAGLVTGLDSARAASLLASARATLPPLEADRRVAVAALATLTAATAVDVEAAVGPSALLPTVDLLPAAGVPSELLQRRPDIRAAERRLAAADADVAAAARQRFPRLTLTGTIGTIATALTGVFGANALAASIGGGLAGPLFDFGRVDALVAERSGRRAEALAAYRGVVLTAVAEVDTELARAQGARDRAARLDAQVRADTDTTEITRIQYRRGLTDFLGVLDAQRSLSAARDARLAEQAAAVDSALRLWRAAGGDLESQVSTALPEVR